MEGIQIDWLVVVIAAILNMVISFLWYSNWLFGKLWMKLSHQGDRDMKHEKSAYLYGFINSLVIAYFLAFFEGYLGVTTVTDGMFVGFCLWLGFVSTTQVTSVIWKKRPIKLFFLDTGAKLLTFLVMGGIIGA